MASVTKTNRKTTPKRTTTTASTDSDNVVPMNSEISEQLSVLREDLKTLAKTVKDQTKTAISERGETAKSVATDQADAAKQRYEELSTKAELQIREKPLTSMAIAVGAGLFLGAILRK